MRSVSRGSVSGFAVIFSTMALASAAQAGGFAVREQSASFQGMSFAGIGTAYDLSSMYWNPAAAGVAGTAVTFESHIALVFPDAHLSGEGSFEPAPGVSIPLVGDGSTEFGKDGVVAASYGAYRLNDKTVLAMSINAPFGLSTKPEDGAWEGNFQGRRSTIFTLNAAPTITYEVMPGLHVGAGVQVEYFRLKFLFGANPGTLTLPTFTNAEIDIDDYGVGATAGVLWQPAPGTSIGLGFRSSIDHDLEGEFFTGRLGSSGGVEANFETPEIVTLGIQHAITPQMRALGTIEWTNWSRLDAVPIVGSGAVLGPLTGDANDRVLEAHWHDGWFYSVGLEYDYSPKLTLRGGVAYEDSPIENADERLPQVPDSDRVWLSAGLTYRYSERPRSTSATRTSSSTTRRSSVRRFRAPPLCSGARPTRAPTSSPSASSRRTRWAGCSGTSARRDQRAVARFGDDLVHKPNLLVCSTLAISCGCGHAVGPGAH